MAVKKEVDDLHRVETLLPFYILIDNFYYGWCLAAYSGIKTFNEDFLSVV